MDTLFNVEHSTHIQTVADLASEIWTEHFTSIIGSAQVVYMLDKFQSTTAITAQIAQGSQYYLVTRNTEPIGYTAVVPDTKTGKLLLSKIYVKSTLRGRGVGSTMLHFIEAWCSKHGYATLWLTVNRFNSSTIEWYRRHGFVTVDEVKRAIGNGFVMDDLIMEKRCR